MPANRNRSMIVCGAVLAAAAALVAFAGPLDPPNGPITPTYKTLSEVEPRAVINAANTPGDAATVYRITSAGSYYLTGPISVPSGKNGIEIAASNVTLDLRGFTITGQNGSLDGIQVTSKHFAITIRNGVVFGLGGYGLNAAVAYSVHVEGVFAQSNKGQGIIVGTEGRVIDCTAEANGGYGIKTADNGTLTNCIARENSGVGLDVDNNGIITGCTSESNVGRGIGGNQACTISNSTASANGEDGFHVDTGSTVTGCSARGNTGYGFHSGGGYCPFTRCNAQANGADGFYLSDRCTASDCTAGGNTGSGFSLLNGNSAKGCVGDGNKVRGITINGSFNIILENNCSQNTTSGIGILSSTGNRIEGNNVTFNKTYGIFIDAVNATSNLVIKNSARGNTTSNYVIPNGNDSGAILNNPGVGFSSSNSWANIEY